MDVKLKVDWCSHEAAKYAVMNWHYSKSMPKGKLVKFGVWEDEKFIGCVLFGRGASPFLGAAYGLASNECSELVRVALDTHKIEVSRVVAICLKKLAQSNNLRLVISFADSNQNHIGAIYQAGNWIYSGKSSKKFQYRDKNGRIWHDRVVTPSGLVESFNGVRQCLKASEGEKIPLLGKHRYLYPLDKAMRRQIAPLAKPYPKKGVRSDTDDTPIDQIGKGGLTPTRTLQNKSRKKEKA